MRTRVVAFALVVVLVCCIRSVDGELIIEIRPIPSIIYHNAPPGVPVLSVKAYDDVTNAPLENVALTSTNDAGYFELSQQPRRPSEYSLKVKRQIDKPIGYVFLFNVYARHNGSFPDRRIKINVTEKNEHAPSFDVQEYIFLALRDGVNHSLIDIGKVHATDADADAYNRIFQYYLLDPVASEYFFVDPSTGDIELIDTLPSDVSNMTFTVTAIDAGSPSLLDSTRVVIEITDVRPPDMFCVAVDSDAARICWKDPTNGSYVMKYELLLQVDGENATKKNVDVKGVDDETCSIIDGDHLGKNYTFTVRVLNGLEWSPESLQRQVRIEKNGLYGDCQEFSNCSLLEPCQNGGECLVNDDRSYTCNCTSGWGGVNCTDVDICSQDPDTCQNGGTCLFTGDRNFTCDCPPTYSGKYCLHFNACHSNPCQNNAECLIESNDTYSCKCGDHFTGAQCETHAPCTPSPCMRGACLELGDSFECACPQGYFGKYCERENVCVLYSPCGVASICELSGTFTDPEYGDTYSCTCSPGYRGDNCEKLDMCELTSVTNRTLCQHNGTCFYKEVSSYHCDCTGGHWGGECQYYDPCFDKPCTRGECKNITNERYTCKCAGGNFGSQCEHFDPCFDKPCHSESSTCHNVTDTEFTCDCPVERYGSLCEKVNGCHINFCHNNASCKNISDRGDVQCFCQPGYTGSFCKDYNPCLLLPCQNGGTCTNNSVDFNCACPSSYRGNTCEEHNPCGENPCWNNGTCVLGEDDQSNYRCTCENIFYGTHCENVHFCHLGNTCQHGGTCTVIEELEVYNVVLSSEPNTTKEVKVTNRPACICHNDYMGKHCENVSPCSYRPCGEGQCILEGEEYICNCPDGTSRLNCDPAFCDEDSSFYDKTGRYVWPVTAAGATARMDCRHGPKVVLILGHATRMCSITVEGHTFWEHPDTSDCLEWSEEEVSENLKNLASLTNDASGLRSEQIANITGMLEEYFFFSFASHEIATEMTMVVGNLLDANESVIIESNSRNHSSERLLWLLDEYVSNVNTSTNVSIETENINLKVVNYTSPELGFSYSPTLVDNNLTSSGGITLRIPSEALTEPESEDYPRIELMTFRSSSFFIPEKEAPPQDVVLKQWVVTAVVNGRNVSNLTKPVEINIQNIENNGNHTCVYWDVENKSWSSEGVVTAAQNTGHTRCLSYHLTSFAILLDPTADHALSSRHEQILTYISYIGCGISMLGLVLTLITYSLFRCLNREKSSKILMNLCASMLIMNIVFVLGSETSLSVSGDVICKVIAILLHYFLLTTLTWMLMEAINMYQALITVFAKYSSFFMLKRCLFAWGVPAIVVIITVSIDVDNYKTTTELCFLSQGNPVAFFSALLGPACFILLINTAVFIMVSRVILRPRFKGQVGTSGDTINPAQIRGAFAVMTLLGITWVFGPLAINEAKVVVNYVFTVLNSLQGFLIFVFRCLFNPEVRMSWMLLVKTGKFKRRKGPVTAYTSDTSSSKGDSKLNGSYAETLKTNVYNNSIGKPRNVLNNDRNLDTKTTNLQSKSTKDLHPYFDDLNKNKGNQVKRTNGVNDGTKLNGRNGHHHHHNHHHHHGHDRNGHGHIHHGRQGDDKYVTTIYTGKYNGIRRLSGYTNDRDEFTRL